MKTLEDRSEKVEGEYALPLWSWKIDDCMGSVPLQSIWALPVLYSILFMLLLGNKGVPRKTYPLSLYSRECTKTETNSRWRRVMERKEPVQVIPLYLFHKLALFFYYWLLSWKAQPTGEYYGVPPAISPIVLPVSCHRSSVFGLFVPLFFWWRAFFLDDSTSRKIEKFFEFFDKHVCPSLVGSVAAQCSLWYTNSEMSFLSAKCFHLACCPKNPFQKLLVWNSALYFLRMPS